MPVQNQPRADACGNRQNMAANAAPGSGMPAAASSCALRFGNQSEGVGSCTHKSILSCDSLAHCRNNRLAIQLDTKSLLDGGEDVVDVERLALPSEYVCHHIHT